MSVDDAEIERFVRGLQEYSSVLQLLVQSLDSGSERRTLNTYLQQLADFDLGHMIIEANMFQITDSRYLKRLQEVLNEINSRAKSAGTHLKGESRPPDLPPAIYTLISNILLVTESSLKRIEGQLPASHSISNKLTIMAIIAGIVLFSALAYVLTRGGQELVTVSLDTSQGRIVVELYPDKAPKTVANFLQYVKSGTYNGTIFHRVIPDFMAQCGGFTADMTQKPTQPPVQNEADNGLTNDRGTLAMARTSDPNSASSQFFINVKDNAFLNHKDKTAGGWGYAVFGKVVEGMDVVDKIVHVPTTTKGGYSDVPVIPVVLTKAQVLGAGKRRRLG